MRMQIPASRGVLVAILGLALLASCKGPSAYRAPVSKFRDSSAVVIEDRKSVV